MDGARSARLLFDRELTAGVVHDRDLDTVQVHEAVDVPNVPARPLRIAQQLGYKLGRLGFERGVAAPLVAARRLVLGDGASGPPRFLVRVDEFPHYRAWDDPERFGSDQFERFHEILAAAGVPYLLAVLPRVSREPLSPLVGRQPLLSAGNAPLDGVPPARGGDLDGGGPRAHGGDVEGDSRPLDDAEVATLARVVREGASCALHGLTHRTRFASPRRHSELCGLSVQATEALLDAGLAELARVGLSTEVFVPPYNRFDAAQLAPLAQRFQVVCGGPESIGRMGFQGTPQWRGETVYLPSYAPFYGRADEVRPAVEHAIEAGWGLWVPIVLHWGWEAEAGWDSLERLAHALAPYAAAWDEFLAAVARSKRGDSGRLVEPRTDSGRVVEQGGESESFPPPEREARQ
jgi:hypothetical protein